MVKKGLAVLLCIGVYLAWKMQPCPHWPRRVLCNNLHINYVPGANIVFKQTASGISTNTFGARSDISKNESSDCVTVLDSTDRFSSPSGAEVEFKSMQEGDFRVVDESRIKPLETTGFGRVIVYYAKEDRFFIITRASETSDRVRRIDSSSLNHALAYEKRFPSKHRQE
jgi:hypothetical protein